MSTTTSTARPTSADAVVRATQTRRAEEQAKPTPTSTSAAASTATSTSTSTGASTQTPSTSSATTASTPATCSNEATRAPIDAQAQAAARTRGIGNIDASLKQQLYAHDPSRRSAATPAVSRAELARTRATESIDAARDSRADAERVRGEAGAAHLASLANKGIGWLTGTSDPARTQALESTANSLGREASDASRLADRLDVRAQDAAQRSLTQQQKANGLAAATGSELPHPAAARATSLTDAARLSAEDQREIFGTELPAEIANARETQGREAPARTAEARRAAQVDASVARISDAANAIEGTDKPYDGSGDEKDARRQTTLAATQVLEDTLRDAPAGQRDDILERSRHSIERMTRGVTILDGDDTKEAVQSLSNAADIAGRNNAHLITDPIASQIARGGLEEKGSFLGKDAHRSEKELKNAVRDVMGDSGNDLFARSLSNQLINHDDAGFAHAIATGGDVPGRNLTEKALGAAGDVMGGVGGALGEVKDFVGDIANLGGDYVRNKIAETAQIDSRVRALNTTGDSFTAALGGEAGALGAQVGAKAQLQVDKLDDGYRVAVSGEANAGIFGALGTKASGASGDLNLTGKVTVEATFDTREEAERAAKTIAGITIGTALGGPIGAAVTAGSAGDEIKEFKGHVSKTRVEVGFDAYGSARAGELIGIGDKGQIGAGAGIGVRHTGGIEWEPGQEPQLVLDAKLSGDASLSLGSKDFTLPDGRSLSLAEARAEGSISLSTRIPLGGANVGDVARDPIGSLERMGSHALDGAMTSVTADVDIAGDFGVGTTGRTKTGRSDSAFFKGGGLNASVSVDVPTRDVGGALEAALGGDLGGALKQLGKNAELDVEINAFREHGLDIDERVDAGLFRVGVKAQHELRDETDVFSYRGDPAGLRDNAAQFFDAINPLL